MATDHTSVVAEMKPWTIYPWIAAFVAGAAFMLYRDFNGEGLAGSIYYGVFGVALYPIFYGLAAYAIYHFSRMLIVADQYMRISRDQLIIGPTSGIDRREITALSIERNWLGLEELRVQLRGGRRRAIRSYAISRPISEVLATLEDWRGRGT